MSVHQDGPDCLGCQAKLAQAHPFLADWFNTKVKPKYPNAHVSWSYRNEQEQNQFLDEGRSELPYPQSAHNHTENAKPCAYALDLFEEVSGKGIWSPSFFASVNSDVDKEGLPIFWGGRWKELGDKDHFQYRPPIAKKA